MGHTAPPNCGAATCLRVHVKVPVPQVFVHSLQLPQGALPGQLPALVHTYDASPGLHPCFGELALMYDKPRAATVRGTVPTSSAV